MAALGPVKVNVPASVSTKILLMFGSAAASSRACWERTSNEPLWETPSPAADEDSASCSIGSVPCSIGGTFRDASGPLGAIEDARASA